MDTLTSGVGLSKNSMVITCQSSLGNSFRENITHLTRHSVVFEVCAPTCALLTSEVLREVRILLDDRLVYSGEAVVRTLVNAGHRTVCEAVLDGGWLDVNLEATFRNTSRLRESFQSFMHHWQQLHRILPEYKLVVADMQCFLLELQRWLEQVELGVRAAPSQNRSRLELEIVQELGSDVVKTVNSFFERFEGVAMHIEPDMLLAHQAYMKQHLHPLVLCSPFAYRTYHKPLGYAGDYEMVNMIVRNPYEGSSLFAKIVNLWFLMQPPAEAHRNRIDYLVDRLQEETLRVSATGSKARILNLGCGPAIEVQRFFQKNALCERAQFCLLDFNEETLRHAAAVLAEAKRKHGRDVDLQFVKKPVHQLLKEAAKTVVRPSEQQYDFIYCAGLFDYLPDDVCRRLTALCYSWVAPGGLLLATNVDPSNPLRKGMDHLLDWHLVYRNRGQLQNIRPSQVPVDQAVVQSDLTGVDLIMTIRKDRYA